MENQEHHNLPGAAAATAETSGTLMGNQTLAAFGQAAGQPNALGAFGTTLQSQYPDLNNANNMVASAATVAGGQQVQTQQPASLMANLFSNQVVQQPQVALAAQPMAVA